MSLIAAVTYGPDDDCDALLAAFAHDLLGAGVAVAGLIQINAGAGCAELDMELEALGSGRRINICQDLGPGSANACRLDPAGLAEAAAALRQALDRPARLVVINKFGRMEAEGGGLIGEIGATVAAGLPLLIGVPERFAAAWDTFAGGMDEKLACKRAALEAWWAARALPAAAE
jgi:molybdate transport system ATP-binding protein